MLFSKNNTSKSKFLIITFIVALFSSYSISLADNNTKQTVNYEAVSEDSQLQPDIDIVERENFFTASSEDLVNIIGFSLETSESNSFPILEQSEFAGSFIDDNGDININLVSEKYGKDKKHVDKVRKINKTFNGTNLDKIPSKKIKINNFKYSQKELYDVIDFIDFDTFTSFFSCYPDIANNKIHITINKNSDKQDFDRQQLINKTRQIIKDKDISDLFDFELNDESCLPELLSRRSY